MAETLLLNIVEENLTITREKRTVVEHEHHLQHERTNENHIPHHPINDTIIKITITKTNIIVQLENLERLQQRTTNTVRNALGLSDDARSEENEHRMIERHLREVDVRRLIAAQPFIQAH